MSPQEMAKCDQVADQVMELVALLLRPGSNAVVQQCLARTKACSLDAFLPELLAVLKAPEYAS